MKYPLWKPVLIVLVLVGCASLILTKGLKPGIDLAGGTTLVYDVLVPDGADAESVIADTISIQSQRVDSSGVKNLIWRQEAGNRISVTMAQASPIVQERREAYEQQREAMLKQTLDVNRVSAALAMEGQAREKELDELAGGDDGLRDQLDALVLLADARDAAQPAYAEANEAWQEALEAGGDEPSEQEQAEIDARFAELNEKAAAFSEARDEFAAARATLQSRTVDAAEVDRILALSNEERPGAEATPRQQAIDSFAAEHAAVAEPMRELAKAYADYESVKGPLDDPEDLKRMLRGAGVLEFRIAAQPNGEPADLSSYVQRLEEKGPRAGMTEDWRWFKIQSLDQFVDQRDVREAMLERPETATAWFASRRALVARPYGGDIYVLLANTPGMAMTHGQNWELTGTSRLSDQMGRPSVGFSLDGQGAALMSQLTGGNVGRQMAIVLDGELMSAPTLQSQLSAGGTITGDFNQAEYQYLLNTLGAGSLEGQLSYDPISQKTTGPSLGQDNLHKGLRACVTALVVVSLFMAVYYLFAGLVADFALLANMVIILGIMSLIEATFTLPGIAGLVLTIGMAVDANVLIFERIREELDAKADLHTAVREGFAKALSTILDANVTTLITCVVLGYTATAEVKGFAVVLGIGILATMFTALFCSRVFIELYMLLFRAKTLPMLPTLVPAIGRLFSPNVNWISKGKLFIPVSAVLLVAGFAMVLFRGSDILDIEFRSGTEVTFNLADGQSLPIAEVRDRLEHFGETEAAKQIDSEVQATIERLESVNADRPDDQKEEVPTMPNWSLLADANLLTLGDPNEQGEATGFSVATLIENSSAVSDAIRAMFRDELDVTESVEFRGQDLDVSAAKGVVEPVTSGSLYDSLGRQFREPDPSVENLLGGVAIVLEDVTPALSLEDVQERITRMRRQPGYEDLSINSIEVLGLRRSGEVNRRNQPTFTRFAVVMNDYETNYAEDRSDFANPQGLAASGWNMVRDALSRDTSLASVSNFSSQVSGTMKQQAITAMVLSLLAVVAYIWLRFGSLRYGIAAIAALVHDVSITLGILAICGYLVEIPGFHQALLLDNFKINLALVAALLTIVGYSLNDTIVVFDRIRENRGRLPRATPQIISDSINQTISRTVLTSGTTLIAVVVLYILGGPGVHGFAFAMLVGILVGTYSSIAIAAPILLIGDKSGKDGQVKPVSRPAVSETGKALDTPPATM